jgi:Mrp family chromosome partitioning ATPase
VASAEQVIQRAYPAEGAETEGAAHSVKPQGSKPLVQTAMESLAARREEAEGRHGYRSDRNVALPAVAPPPVRDAAVYRALAVNLWARCEDPQNLKVLLFVGAAGRTECEVAANFAAFLARESHDCVLLLDDAAASEAGGARAIGPASPCSIDLPMLLASGAAPQPPRPGSENLYLLPTGGPGALSASVLRLKAIEAFFRTVRQLYAAVIVRAPDPALHPDALLLCRWSDGVVLTLDSEHTRMRSAAWIRGQIEESGGRLLGVVLNRRRYRIPRWIYRRI